MRPLEISVLISFPVFSMEALGAITGVNADSDQFHVDFKEAAPAVGGWRGTGTGLVAALETSSEWQLMR